MNRFKEKYHHVKKWLPSRHNFVLNRMIFLSHHTRHVTQSGYQQWLHTRIYCHILIFGVPQRLRTDNDLGSIHGSSTSGRGSRTLQDEHSGVFLVWPYEAMGDVILYLWEFMCIVLCDTGEVDFYGREFYWGRKTLQPLLILIGQNNTALRASSLICLWINKSSSTTNSNGALWAA